MKKVIIFIFFCTIIGCKNETPISHYFCVGDLDCRVTAKFSTMELCHYWENVEKQNDTKKWYESGYIRTYCKAE